MFNPSQKIKPSLHKEMQTMISTLRLLLLTTAILLFSGCSTTADLTRQQVMQQYDNITEFEALLLKSKQSGVDYLAPTGYKAAKSTLESAIESATGSSKAEAKQLVKDGKKQLLTAEADAEKSRAIMREVLEIRARAIGSDADKLLKEPFNDLEESLQEATQLVEQGEIEEAKQSRPELMTGYSQLELSALKKSATQAAMRDISNAKEKLAEEYAPKTLKLAEDELGFAISVLEANRTHTDKAKRHALRASWQAHRSVEIVELVTAFEQHDNTQEEVILWYQDQLAKINQPAGNELPFDRPNHEIVALLQNKIASLHEAESKAAMLEEAELETRKNLQGRLETIEKANRDAQARYDKIQSMFSESEANVYRQGHNVLLETHAFYFPVGGSEIQSENFDLLDKIVKAIKLFPTPSIIVRGHTDATGSDQNNLTLSQQRSEKVAAFLGTLSGIDVQSIISTGFGETRPVASNETEAGRALNRRIEILIINQ